MLEREKALTFLSMYNAERERNDNLHTMIYKYVGLRPSGGNKLEDKDFKAVGGYQPLGKRIQQASLATLKDALKTETVNAESES
jgi:hypothetical protein